MVVFSVCFIVLVAIAHQVVQSEAIVAGDEIDAALGAFARLGVDVGTAADAAGKQTEHPIIAAPETPDIISVPAVPLRPAAFGEAPDLIRSGGIPRLGDDFHVSQDRVLGDPFQKRGIGQQLAGAVPAENRRQVKPESIDMHLDHPITERGQDVVSHHGMVGVDGVAGSRVVLVVAFVARQRVEDRVIHPTETERRPQFISLRRVIEHHVQDHFNSGFVKGLNHFPELQFLLAQTSRTAVGSFGRKENHGIVSPVILEWLACLRIDARCLMFIELLYRHQLHGRHSQVFEIGDLFH